MTAREERTVELNVISASDLKKVKTFGKQASFVVAYVYPQNKKSTKVDKDGGVNPSWNSKLTLTADEHQIEQGNAFITVEIFSPGAFGDKLVGTVIVPLSDIAKERKSKEGKEGKEGSSTSEPQFLAFEVRRPSGKAKGLINLSVSLGEKRTIQVYQNQPRPQQYGQSSVPLAYPQYDQYPPQQAYPPQYGYAPQQQGYYPQQQAPYYPQQGYPQQGYAQRPPRRGGMGGLGGAGLGLGAGLLGGLLVADLVDDIGDNDYGGGDYGGGDFGGGDF